ncbi:MAG: hypothetical protein QOC59_1001, partial [Microbacteriaceae bacterium]|nr:hypothetical protein [Microbacteriaceae bacterium]
MGERVPSGAPDGLTVLIAATPQHAHVTPLLAVAAALVAEGVRVVVLTGRRFQAAVEAVGATFTPVDEQFDYDDRELERVFPGMVGRTGLDAMKYAARAIFLPPMPSQLVDVEYAASGNDAGVVVTDPLFLGGIAYALLPRERRLPVAVIGLVPLMVDSRDTAPFGLGIRPLRGPLGRLRNALLRVLARRVLLADIAKEVDHAFVAAIGVHPGRSIFDVGRTVDLLAQLTVPSFEYPRSDLPRSVRFVGPLRSPPARHAALPDWWGDLAGRTVVHVTQGTVANAQIEDLLLPAIRGLAGEDVLVVAATGRRDPRTVLEALGRVPENLRIAEFLPYDSLMPLTDVMVTNGGYGGVHAALRHGVPLVVAGRSEEKVEVNARVQWSGVGVNLRTQRARPAAVAAAVRTVLRRPSYRA